MPPLPPLANTLKYRQAWVCGINTKPESIFYFQYSGGPPSASVCAALAADFQAAAVTNFKPVMGSDYKVGLGTVQDIGSSGGAEGEGGTATAGTLTGLNLTAGTACVINHSIARRYRGGKPRTYGPFGDATEIQTVGTWTSAFVAAVQSGFGAFITACLAASSGGVSISGYGVVSYYLNGALRTTPSWEPITASIVRVQIGSQRRRLKGS